MAACSPPRLSASHSPLRPLTEWTAPLSRRQSRYMTRRYRSAWSTSTAVHFTPKTTHTSTSFARRRDLRAQAAALGLVGKNESHSDDKSNKKDTSDGVSDSNSTGCSVHSMEDDPLMVFLERNEEEAAMLLAMWTSLRRCCLHASEISESLSLGARWFLHHLIHRRAIAAAVRFYHRLVDLGVQLQKWDVLVLLSNLPYEHSTTVDGAQTHEWRRAEVPWMKRGSREKRRALDPDVKRTNYPNGVECPSSSSRSTAARALSESVAETENGATCVSPEWVRRWALYEESMGNVDLSPSDGRSVVAAMRHLMLLHDAAVQQDAWCHTLPTHSSQDLAKRQGRTRRGTTEPLYWAQALHVASAHLTRGLPLPPAALRLARCAAAASGSWRVAARCIGEAERHKVELNPADYARFVLVATAAAKGGEPWRCNAAAESFVSHHIVPRLSHDTAAGHAARAIWFAHLCNVKAERPAEYVMLAMESANATQNDQDGCSNDSGSIGCATKLTVRHASLAAALLRVELSHYRRSTRNEQAVAAGVATSVRLGLFNAERDPVHSSDHPHKNASLPSEAATVSVSVKEDGLENNMEEDCVEGTLTRDVGLLPEELRDGLALTSTAVARAAAVAPAVGPAELALLIAEPLHTLRVVFADAYGTVTDKDTSHVKERAVAAAAVGGAELRVALAMCAANAAGAVPLTTRRLRHVLSGAADTLSFMAAKSKESTPTPDVRRAAHLTGIVLPSLWRSVMHFLRLTPNSERLLFAAADDDAVGTLAALVLVTVQLHFAGAVQPAQTRRLLQRVLRPGSEIAEDIRRRLTCSNLESLERILCFPTGYHVVRKIIGEQEAESINAAAAAHAVVYNVALRYDNDTASIEDELIKYLKMQPPSTVLLFVRAATRDVRLRRGTLGLDFFTSAINHMTPARSTHVPTAHTNPNTAIATTNYNNNTTPTATMTHGKYIVNGDRANHIPSESKKMNNGNTDDFKCESEKDGLVLWKEAVAVLDEALAHTTYDKRKVWSVLLVPMARLSLAMGQPNLGRSFIERWVAQYHTKERDTNWVILHIRALSALRERRALRMSEELLCEVRSGGVGVEIASVEVLLCDVAAEHGDWRRAMTALTNAFGPIPEKAVHKAKGMDTENAYGPCSSKGCGNSSMASPLYLPIVAAAMMRILCRAPENLSNTALRLRSVQGMHWDVCNASRLLWLLVRHRRWRQALEHVQEMLPLLDTPRDGTSATVRERALFLLHGLRACAIGGCDDEAAILYDRLKELLNSEKNDKDIMWNRHSSTNTTDNGNPSSGGSNSSSNSSSSSSNGCGSSGQVGENPNVCFENGSKIVVDKTQQKNDWMMSINGNDTFIVSSSDKVNAEEEELRAIATKARLYFIRAMTKKSLAPFKKPRHSVQS